MTEGRVGKSLINFAPRITLHILRNVNFIIVWVTFSFVLVWLCFTRVCLCTRERARARMCVMTASYECLQMIEEQNTRKQNTSHFLLIYRLLLLPSERNFLVKQTSAISSSKWKTVIEFCHEFVERQSNERTNERTNSIYRASHNNNCLCYIRFINDFQLEWLGFSFDIFLCTYSDDRTLKFL